MEYTINIPSWNKTKFDKYIKSLQRKGLDIKIVDLGKTVETVDGTDYMCNAYSISNEVLYQENGWHFVGTIEHKEGGNIIRKAIDVAVPKRYETAPCECEHCHTIRNRIDTYLVYNGKDFKQVGKTCLKAYTGLNPSICALAMSLEAELEKMSIDHEEVTLGGYNTFGAFRGFEADRVKKLAYEDIKARGYRKETQEVNGKMVNSSKDYIVDVYSTKKDPLVTDEEIAAVDAWVDGLDTQYNEYFRNASLAYKEKYYEYRDLALVISLISCYFRDVAKKAEQEARAKLRAQAAKDSQDAGYLGEVGDKVEFEVVSDSILFRNAPYAYGGSYTYVHRMIDTNGHVILWSTGEKAVNYDETGSYKGAEFDAGTKIKATVKAHKDFRGELQTVVTRGKVL